jgi:hypothetical protein
MDHKAPKLTEATGDRAIGGERAEQFVPKLTSLSTSRSRNFITYLLNWLKVMHVMAAIRAIKVSRPLTKFFLATIFKDWLEKKYTKDDFRGLKLLYIYELIPDEVSKSLTVVADLEKKQTIYAGRGQGERALKGFWKALGSRGAKKIKALAMDMDREHISQTKKRCPNVVFVFERFRLGKRTNFKGLGEGL